MTKNDAAEATTAAFYRTAGWEVGDDGVTEDARRWEDLRPSSAEYVSRCRRRVLTHIEGSRFILDMASGPIQYDEYLEYSAGFEKRYCVDLSPQALDLAKRRIGEHGEFVCGSFFDLPFADDFFDTSISLHTIYHMGKDRQEEAVRKLLRVTKGPVVIVYSNPNAITSRLKRAFAKPRTWQTEFEDIYYYTHPLEWWDRFNDVAEIKMYPWRFGGVHEMQMFIPGGVVGKWMLKGVNALERAFPAFFVRHFRYPIIVLRKRQASSAGMATFAEARP